ncbi:YeiH family protein [Alkalicoccobacillus plakortidis]|uniref:YeiH family protein n=1 Tax=Alkalicoccobacillus plakortidis TaxID=444060 RepID=A0ABT0XNZ2_9BACI|nr:YeiH family protein [Alkalicoccobacillus plakortidis]MCM2677606.1 YeiH family protein [Alkalicoccobacillus plakortidis]
MQRVSFSIGLGLTLCIAGIAFYLAKLPFLNIVGQLVIAIILGIVWRATAGMKPNYMPGVEFSSTRLLRIGIVLLGLRLNLLDIYQAGLPVFFYAFILLVSTIGIVYGLCRALRVDKTVSILTACGTAICGAAAILAVAPILKAKEQSITIAVAVIAVLGTTFTILYTVIFSWLPLSDFSYGILSGGTLHEVAHVVAASSVGGEQAEDMAIIVKLTRVALLVPVALALTLMMQKGNHSSVKHQLPIPWFLFGFIGMSLLNTLGIVPAVIVDHCITLSYLLLAMAMAGLGLKMDVRILKKQGGRVFVAALIGSVCLVLAGYGLLVWFPIMP